ncbi:MAG: hypothetical protein ACT452_19630 [Microthrixaceae bacterium]
MGTTPKGPTSRMAVAALAALLLAACGGGGGDDANVAARGGDGSTTTALGGGADASTGGVAVEAGSGGATSSTTATEASTGASSKAAPGSGSTASVSDDTPGLPAAGQYRFHTTGTTKFGANPEQPVEMDTTTTVVHLGDGKVRQTGDDQESVLQWTGDQVLLHTLDLTRPGFERHFEAKPPVQFAPADLQVGQAWGWKLTATGLPTTIEQASRVDRLETITNGGRSVDVIVVVTKITISGDVNGTIDMTQWVDRASDQITRIHAKTSIATYAFTSDTTSEFTGFTPG